MFDARFSCFCFTSRPEIAFRVKNISIYSVVLLSHSVIFIVLRGLGGGVLMKRTNVVFDQALKFWYHPPGKDVLIDGKTWKLGFLLWIFCKFQNKRKFPADPRKRPADLRADAGRSETTPK